MSYEASYIPDGYYLDGYVAAKPGSYQALKFSYRPTTAEQRDSIKQLIRDHDPDKYMAAVRGMLATHVTQWDLVNPTTRCLVPITPAEFCRVHPALHDRLYFIVTGDRPSDVPPDDAADPVKGQSYAEKMLQLAEGKSPEEVALKNSSAG